MGMKAPFTTEGNEGCRMNESQWMLHYSKWMIQNEWSRINDSEWMIDNEAFILQNEWTHNENWLKRAEMLFI